MAPKKKETQKMSLGDFLSDQSYGGSWADEVEDTFASGTQPLPPTDRRPGGYSSSGYGSGGGYGGGYGGGDRGGYSSRDSYPQKIPDKPPYTAHLGNLSYDATVETVTEFFDGCEVVSVRIIEDREQMRPKGFAYAEFATADGLQSALNLDGNSFQGRTIRIKVADPPRDNGRGESSRDLSDWTRKGPLADLPPRGGDRRQGDFGDRRPSREVPDDGKVRDFNNWERKGPLPPSEPTGPRDSNRLPRANDARNDGARNRQESPAAWGEGRQDSRPRRDMADRPERVPSAADKDMQWRNSMRPDLVAKSPSQSRDGSEAPSSPAPAPAQMAGGRPKLNLQKRTVSESAEVLSPSIGNDSKGNPFGAARPIDTAKKEREIEEKRLQVLKEKKEAEEKAKEEKRLAKEAAAKEAAEKEAAEKEAAEKEAAAAKEAAAKAEAEAETKTEEVAASKPNGAGAEPSGESASKETEEESKTGGASQEGPKEGRGNNASEHRVPFRSREPREPREHREPREPRGERPEFKSRATESGNWRQPSGEHRAPRGSGAPRRGGAQRGQRTEGGRGARQNGNPGSQPTTPITEANPSATDEDGWTTVTVPSKGGRRSQPGRPIAS